MLTAVAEMHKKTAERHWDAICCLHQEIGGLSYEKQVLQAEVLRLRSEVRKLSTENRQLRWKVEDLDTDE